MNTISAVANSTLLLTDFPSTLVRCPACTTRKFFPLMAILNGTKLPCIPYAKLHGSEIPCQFNQKRGQQSVRNGTPQNWKPGLLVNSNGGRTPCRYATLCFWTYNPFAQQKG